MCSDLPRARRPATLPQNLVDLRTQRLHLVGPNPKALSDVQPG